MRVAKRLSGSEVKFLQVINKFGTSCQQVVTTLLILSDLLQSCSNKAVTIMIYQYCYNLVLSTLLHSCYIMTVSELLKRL